MNNAYYQFDIRNLHYGELARLAPNLTETVICAVIKTLRIPFLVPGATRYPQQLILVAERAIPEYMVEIFGQDLEESRSLDLRGEFFYKVQALGILEPYCWIGLLEPGNVIASLAANQVNDHGRIDKKIEFDFNSHMSDGRLICSGKKPRELKEPKNWEYQFLRGGTLHDLLEFHRQRVAQDESNAEIFDLKSTEDMVLAGEQQMLDNLIERKALVEATPERLAKMRNQL